MKKNFFKTISLKFLIIIFWILFFGIFIFLVSYQRSSRRLTILAWSDILDPVAIAQFERETGIAVSVSNFSTNEELFVKLKSAAQGEYDLIIPSDYAISLLRKENLLKPLEREKIEVWPHLNPLLLGHPFDPDNTYSIPFSWEIFGLGIYKPYFALGQSPHDWDAIFDIQKIRYPLCMVNDSIEAINMAAFYLYGPVNALSGQQRTACSRLLKEQKSLVKAYSDFRADYFLITENCPVVVASNSYIWRAFKQYPMIDFVIPTSGTFITIENCALPVKSRNDIAVYKFINFILRPEIVLQHAEKYAFCPTRTDIIADLSFSEKQKAIIRSSPEAFKTYHFFEPLVTEQQKNDIWVYVKS